MKARRMDVQLLVSILLLVTAGFFIFLSASLGLLARDSLLFGPIALKQAFFGGVGLIAFYGLSRFNYMFWQKASFWVFGIAIILNIIIFIPAIGLSHGGATRWLLIGSFSFQTSEVLKIASIMFFAAWLAAVKERVSTIKFGLVPLLCMLSVTGILLLLQPDTDTFVVTAAALMAMYFVAGGRIKYLLVIGAIGVMLIAGLAYERPYLRSRIMTFVDPSAHSLTSGYQIQQSLIAIGSGGITGRGFGQSIQKFNYLPEPMGDSIFAVQAEEFGLLGSIVLISLYIFFALRCYKVAIAANHQFGGLLATGIASFMIVQAFLNIGAMVGILPLSGIPLPFVSQGGTALAFALAEAGILLNISRYARMRGR